MNAIDDLLASARWWPDLDAAGRQRVRRETTVRDVEAGGFVCQKGERVEAWVGVARGLVKISNVSLDGRSVTFTGVPAGGWFGEGSMLKDEPRRYDVVALRASRIAYMPRRTFDWLLDTSIAFNRFLILQLNERLAQFIAALEYQRLLGPEARVARCVAQLFNPLLYPGVDPHLSITQTELGYLTGLSRQRVNAALRKLDAEGLLRVEYSGVTVVSLDGLRRFGEP